MSEGSGKEEEKFDFTPEGESLGYISSAQASLLAMESARENPGEYGRRFRGVHMAFEVAESTEDEDYYNVILFFRPQGQFAGTPGQEQFFIGKEGVIAHRQVLGLPIDVKGRRSSAIPMLIGLLVIGAAVAVGVILVGTDLLDSVTDTTPIAGLEPTNTPSPSPAPSAPGSEVTSTNPKTPTPSEITTSTPMPVLTPTEITTATPTLVPTPSSYIFSINGVGVTNSGATICQGLAMLEVRNGAVTLSPLPGPGDRYPTNTVVYLDAYPNESNSIAVWNGVDSYSGNRATKIIGESNFINVSMVPLAPTKIPPTPREGPSDTDGDIISISQPCFVVGERNTVTATFKNTGMVQTHFRISIDSSSPGWVKINQCPRVRDGVCEYLNVDPGSSVPVKFTLQAANPGVGEVTWKLLAAHTCGLFGCRWDVEVDRRTQSFSVFTP